MASLQPSEFSIERTCRRSIACRFCSRDIKFSLRLSQFRFADEAPIAQRLDANKVGFRLLDLDSRHSVCIASSFGPEEQNVALSRFDLRRADEIGLAQVHEPGQFRFGGLQLV